MQGVIDKQSQPAIRAGRLWQLGHLISQLPHVRIGMKFALSGSFFASTRLLRSSSLYAYIRSTTIATFHTHSSDMGSVSTNAVNSAALRVSNPYNKVGPLKTPIRLLCGPGPGNAHPRVHAAMSLSQVGHMDPAFLAICEDVKQLLRYVWQTNNTFTIPVSGTGSAAWEAAVANLTEPNDVHLVFVNGYFGERHCDMASRYGAKIIRMDKKWGTVFTYDEIEESIRKFQPSTVWICYAETSTGTRQPLEGIGAICRSLEKECLLMVDTVTAIGGVEIRCDEWLFDVSYAGTQKCLSCPPGVAPLTLGPRALARMERRASKGIPVPNWYLDMNMIAKYLFATGGGPRVYHHTAPISMIYALREALTLIAEEGLENVWKRHKDTASFFWKCIECELGLKMLVEDEKCRLPSLHTVLIPHGVDGGAVIEYCREKFQIEIGGGLGQLAGKVFRVGLMGFNSRPEVVLEVVAALKAAMVAQGWVPPK